MNRDSATVYQNIIAQLLTIANELDEQGLVGNADVLTKVAESQQQAEARKKAMEGATFLFQNQSTALYAQKVGTMQIANWLEPLCLNYPMMNEKQIVDAFNDHFKEFDSTLVGKDEPTIPDFDYDPRQHMTACIRR